MSTEVRQGIVLAILNKERDKFFMHQRGEGRSQKGDILFISGHVDEGETNIEAINREVAEELGGHVNLSEIIPLAIDPPPTSKRGTVLHGYLISGYEGKLPPTINDTGDETLWVDIHEAAASEVDSVRMIAGAAISILQDTKQI